MNGTIEHSDGLTAHEEQLFRDVEAHEQDYNYIIGQFARIIAPIGILLNSIFLFVVIRVKSMRTIINVYLSSLAVADATNLTLGMSITWAIQNTHTVDPGASLASHVALSTMQIASYCFVTVIAVERFFAVRQPLTQRAQASKSRAAKVSAGIWVAALVTGVLGGFLTSSTYVKNEVFTKVAGVLFLLIYLATFTITISSYIYIVIKLCHSDRERQVGQTRRVYPVVRMLVINSAVFFLLSSTEIALTVNTLIILFSSQSGAEAVLDMFWTSLDLLFCVAIFRPINCSINTLVYSATSSQYRAAFLEAFPPLAKLLRQCRRCRRPQQTEQIELRVIPPVKAAQESPVQAH
ncbi:G-protein coupled receptor 35-like [Patiria miniata]|uniref:G-protein coupled receptors family 1 profile domain-containing protein n=1 Tax=Patiria miniata TaxID=46514 RepID=A0A914A9V0_PATMI|nr:G-protein coupled receptor 35-like [Patiria miniata]